MPGIILSGANIMPEASVNLEPHPPFNKILAPNG